MQWLKEFFNDGPNGIPPLEEHCSALELENAEQRGMIIEKDSLIAKLEEKLASIEANGGYGYRQQHFEWLNKESLRLSHLCREFSQNNEKLHAENMELTEALKKAKSRKKTNE